MKSKKLYFPFERARHRDRHPFVYRPHLIFHTPRRAKAEWDRKTRACQEFDPQKSFIPGGPGYEQERLWSYSDKPCADYETWCLGKKAYDMFVTWSGEQPTNRELRDVLDQCRALAKEYYPLVRPLIAEGKLTLSFAATPEDALEALDESSFPWLLHLIYQFAKVAPGLDRGVAWEAVAAVCCLYNLDDVVIALWLDGRGSTEAYLQAQEFIENLELDALVRQEATKLAEQQQTQKARDAARKRHEPSRRVREAAIRLYSEGKWSSRRDAVRRLLPKLEAEARAVGYLFSHDRFPQTVYEWLSAHDKDPRLPADV